MVAQIMEDEEDLDSLRKAALSSLLKNQSGTSSRSCNSNTLFHRPTTNKNIISIIPVTEEPNSASKTSSLDPEADEYVEEEVDEEYVVIGESDDVDDDEVDEIIEEVIEDEEDDIVTEEVVDSAEEEETSNKSDDDEAEGATEEVEQDDDDALSFASNDAFMEEVFHALETEQPDQTENSKCFRKLENKLQNKTFDNRRRSRSRSTSLSRRRSISPSRRKATDRSLDAKHKTERSRPSGSRHRSDNTSKSRRDTSPRRKRLSRSRSRSPLGKEGSRRREVTPPKKTRRDMSPVHQKSSRVENGHSRKNTSAGDSRRLDKLTRPQRKEGYSSHSPKGSPKLPTRTSSVSPPPTESRSKPGRKSHDISASRRDKSNIKRSSGPSNSKMKEETKGDSSSTRSQGDKVMESRRAKFEQNKTVVVGSESKKIKLHTEKTLEMDTGPVCKIDSTDILKVERQGASGSHRGEDQEDLRTKLLQKRATASTRIFSSALKSTLVVAADVAKKTAPNTKKTEANKAEDTTKGRKGRRLSSKTHGIDQSSTFRKNKRKVSLIR